MFPCWSCGQEFLASNASACPSCGQPVAIPFGDNSAERRQYIGQVRKVATTLFCENGVWGPKPNRPNEPDKLVEVWDEGGHVTVHPSRNPFHWVTEPQQKALWHRLATTPNLMTTMSSATYSLAARGVSKYTKPAVSHMKPFATPAWATEANVVGYTSREAIRLTPATNLLTLDASSVPSVYYRAGHATLEHARRGNIGWEFGPPARCLFFANVPVRHVPKKK